MSGIYVYQVFAPKKIGRVMSPVVSSFDELQTAACEAKYDHKIMVRFPDGREVWDTWYHLKSVEENIAVHQKAIANHTKRLNEAKKHFGE